MAIAALTALAGPALGQLPAAAQFLPAGKAHLPRGVDDTASLAWCDVDGDGDLDLLVGSFGYPSGARPRLHLNDGNGVFTEVTASHLPWSLHSTRAFAVGDVDGDGDPDVVLANCGWGNSEPNRLFLNNGSGVFTDVTAFRLPMSGAQTNAVALGDVDGDGDLDLIFGNRNTWGAQAELLLNDGRGWFHSGSATHLPSRPEDTFALALGDVDGDGDLDLVLGNGGQNRLYRNNGSGQFADVTASVLPTTLDDTFALVFGDVDGDGDLDLVVGNGGYRNGQRNRLYRNNGIGAFTDVTAASLPSIIDWTAAVAFGDVDGDGDLDLLVGNAGKVGQQDCLWLNDGTGVFRDTGALHMPSRIDRTTAVALGDVDGDGDIDIVVGNSVQAVGEQNRLLRNDGHGTFDDVTTSHLPPMLDSTTAIALGDVDGDGDLDLIVGNSVDPGQQNRLYINDGRGMFTDVTASHLPPMLDSTSAIALGDVDGDGDLDLIVGNSSPHTAIGQQNRLCRNDGNGAFTDVTTSQLPSIVDQTFAIALGDVDGDGVLDLVVGNGDNQQNRLCRNNGSGVFADVTASHMPSILDQTFAIALGDVDSDGDLDLVVGNGGQNRLCLNNGQGVFTDVTAAHLPVLFDWTSAVAFGDIDGDGDLDLVVGDLGHLNAPNRLYRNDGRGIFTDVTAARMPRRFGSTRAVALADVDCDGDPDLIIGNGGYTDGQQNGLLLNLHRHIHTPWVLRPGRSFQVDTYARNASAGSVDVALPYLSTTRISLHIAPFGILGITPDAALGVAPIPQSTGVASLLWNVPNRTAFVGLDVFAQALILSTGAGHRLTNVTGDIVIR